MIHCFETDNFEVWEGPPVGKVLKVFVFGKGTRSVLAGDEDALSKVNEKLSQLSHDLETGNESGVVFMSSVDSIEIVPRKDLPEEVLAKLG